MCAAALMLASCTKDLENRVGALESDVQALQQQMTELNNEISNLQDLIEALQNNVYVTGVTEIKEGDKVIGYTISLSKGQAITIYHGTDGKNGNNGKNGADGATPEISVILEDGVYYWAVNGEFVTDAEGNRIAVNTASDAPEFKYENDQWWISVDGQQWSPLASSAGTSEGGVFSDVKYDDATVTFVLADGTEIVLPREVAFSLNIDKTTVVVLPGETVKVSYTITGATETTSVYAMADGGYTAKVEAAGVSEGTIAITAPNPATDGKVVVFAGDNTRAAMQVLTFEEGTLTAVTKEFEVKAEGGVVEVPVVTNLDYEVSVNADWITYVETKAVREETVVLNVTENTDLERTAVVSLTVGGASVQDITITQKAAASSEARFTMEDLYGDWTVSFGTAGKSYVWTFAASDDQSKGNATVVGIFGKNKHNQKVYVNFDVYTGKISIEMGQECEDDYGYTGVYLTSEEGADVVEYTMTEKGKFGNPTATIAYLYYSSTMGALSNISAVKVDPNKLALGNYYYSDGTCTSTLDASKTVVGVVFWLGDATATDPILKAAFPGCTNGLAMAVTPINEVTWQTTPASIGGWQADNMADHASVQIPYQNGATNLDNCLGYSNTQVLKAYNQANPDTKADVYEALVTFAESTPAPEGTSGWYIPSAKEVTYLVSGNNSNAFNAMYQNNLTVMNEKITAAGFTKITFGYLATSTEISESLVWAYQSSYLNQPSKTYSFTLCPIFAF